MVKAQLLSMEELEGHLYTCTPEERDRVVGWEVICYHPFGKWHSYIPRSESANNPLAAVGQAKRSHQRMDQDMIVMAAIDMPGNAVPVYIYKQTDH